MHYPNAYSTHEQHTETLLTSQAGHSVRVLLLPGINSTAESNARAVSR